jgi:hypothetical protein
VRNSSLVEWSCAENYRGSSLSPKLWIHAFGMSGRGALCTGRSYTVRRGGRYTRENVGISSVRQVRILPTESLRFPEVGSSTQG